MIFSKINRFINSKFQINQENYLIWLFCLYVANHGWILFILNAIFWDDWTLYGLSSNLITETFEQQGSVFNINALIHNNFLIVGPWFYRVLTFFMIFGSGLALNEILKKYSFIKFESRFIIVLFFLILPFYSARVALIVMPYTLSIFLFFTAWAMLEKHRFPAIVFFFISFNTNSLLVFYALPFLDLFFRTNSKITIVNLIKFCIKNIFLVLLPFLYFFIEVYAYPPKDLFEGYNQNYALANLVISPIYMFWNWIKLEINIFVFFVFFVFFSFFQIFNTLSKNLSQEKFNIFFIFLGLSIFILGGFAYWILGHTPIFNDWNSRHQLLLPLGTSIILLSIILASRPNFREPLLITFLSISLFLNVNSYKDFYIDWKKQNYLAHELSLSEDIKKSDIVVFHDETSKFNSYGRNYRNYEWNGLLFKAFNDEKRFGVDMNDFQKLIDGSLYEGLIFQADKFRASEFEINKELNVIEVKIKSAIVDSSISEKLSFFDPQIKLEIINADKLFIDAYNDRP